MYEKLPEQLKKDGRFCLWKYEERNGRMTKVPYQTNGRKASSADKNTFSDFRLAVNAMDGYDGIGMGAFDDFCMSGHPEAHHTSLRNWKLERNIH